MRYFTFVLACFLSVDALAQSSSIRGKVTTDSQIVAPIRLFAIKLQVLKDGQVAPPSKPEIFTASVSAEKVMANLEGEYEFSLEPGHYSVFAFSDLNADGSWNPETPEPFGWYATQPSGTYVPVEVGTNEVTGIDFALHAPRPFSDEPQVARGGTFRHIKGYPVLQLTGNAQDRGYAHGKLVAPQIIDFFRFYFLEDKMQSARGFEEGFYKFLNTNFAYPEPFVVECQAVIEGMKDSGTDMFIPELDREFSLTDLYAINCYIETRAMRTSCTQFAAWGERTENTDVEGGMITGRNMDGEIDLRKVTVNHFLLFAVDPSEPNTKRYVSMMWPGFVATISGINEEGFYTMENAGVTGRGSIVNKLVPFSWTMRESLARLGAEASPDLVQRFIDDFDNSAGGVCGPGCITLFAVPFKGQDNPAFILEGDRFGDAMRLVETASPRIPNVLVASNHHHKYGVDPAEPGMNFGMQPTFSSQWRYEAGMHKLEGWHRTDRKIGTAEMRDLLQTVAHGTTEYAIITRPNESQFDVAVASMKAEPWDAPYREWTTFDFLEVFIGDGEP